MSISEFSVSTGKQSMYEITDQVASAIRDSGVKDGVCIVFCPHTTAAITINENADSDVVHDFLIGLDEAFPDRSSFRHAEGNSSAHLKSSCVGASETILVKNGKPVFGTWQGVYFCEFDGPRSRRFYVKVV